MKIGKWKEDDIWQSGVNICFIKHNVEVVSHEWDLFVKFHKAFVIDWMHNSHLQVKISRIQSPFYLIFIGTWTLLKSQSIFNYFAHISKLICLIPSDTFFMNQIVSLIINEASQEGRATSNKLET